MVVHDIPCVPVQWHIIKQHKLVPQGTLSNGFPGRTWGLVISPAILGGDRLNRARGQGIASPAYPVPCVGSSLEVHVDYSGGVVAREQRDNGTVWDELARRGIKNSEGSAPARSHQDQGSDTASWIQSHPDDAIVQSHRTVSLGGEGP